MSKRSLLIIISIIVIGLVVLGLYSTVASSSTTSSGNNVYNITLTENGSEVSVPSGESKVVIYQVTNTNKGTVKYGVTYSGNNIKVKVFEDSQDKITGNINYGETKFIKLLVTNTGSSTSTASIKGVLGYENGGELDGVVPSGYTLVTDIQLKPKKLSEYITYLYLNNRDNDLVANNDISYRYASLYDKDDDNKTSGGLMNDRKGSMSISEDKGNIRYYGANPNNYIDIGDTELNGNGDEIPTLYRIIGLFKDIELSDGTKKDLVKVIRNEPIGVYSWDQSPKDIYEGYGINEWSQADLMKLLNPGYENEAVGGSLYWNNHSGTCYGYDHSNEEYTAVSCDFTHKGLSVNARNKIEIVNWNLGGNENEQVYSNQIYEEERGINVIQNPYDGIPRTTIWTGQIALAYPSDYGYAADLNACSNTLNEYNNCIGTNWMYNSMASSSVSGWLFSPVSNRYSQAWYVVFTGDASYKNIGVYFKNNVSPSFYLASSLVIVEGNGSKENPYKVSFN